MAEGGARTVLSGKDWAWVSVCRERDRSLPHERRISIIDERVALMDTKASETKKQEVRRNGWLWRMAVRGFIVAAAVVALVVIGMTPKPDREVPPTETPTVNVTVMPVAAESDFADTFTLPAVIEPNRVVTIAAEIAARVERIPPEEGDRIEAGDLLVQLNEELIRPQFDTAQAQRRRDQIEFERMEALVKEDATSRQDLDNATTALASSTAQLAEVKARLDRTKIFTPLSGILNDLPIEEGEYVQAGTPVAEVVDMSVVKVVVNVPERDIAFFAVGQKADVLLEARGRDEREETIQGSITFINELANEQTRSTPMEIALDNSAGRLRSGQIVRVRLTRRVLDRAVLIPLLAVIPLEEGYAVYTVEDSKARRREVELGLIQGDRVQIISGLEPGAKLIVENHRLVAPDQQVNVVSGND